MTVNPVSRLDRYPIPKPEDLFAKLANGKQSSTLFSSHMRPSTTWSIVNRSPDSLVHRYDFIFLLSRSSDSIMLDFCTVTAGAGRGTGSIGETAVHSVVLMDWF